MSVLLRSQYLLLSLGHHQHRTMIMWTMNLVPNLEGRIICCPRLETRGFAAVKGSNTDLGGHIKTSNG